MQLTDLASPGAMPNAMKLRSETFRAISYASIMADLSKGESDTIVKLADYFADCAEQCRRIHAATVPVTPAKD